MGKVLQTASSLLRIVPAVVRAVRFKRGGWYALRTAIDAGDLNSLVKITRQKKWPRCKEDPLTLAARLGKTSLVRHLVEDAGLASSAGLTSALSTAAGIGNVELVSLLMEAIVKRTGERFERALGGALKVAASTGQLSVCQLLLGNGADVNHRDGPLDYTSLMWSIMHGHREITRELVAHGADVDAVAVNGACPVEIAVSDGDLESLKILLDAGALVDLPTTPFADGVPINAADLALVSSPRIVEYLTSRGVMPKRGRPA